MGKVEFARQMIEKTKRYFEEERKKQLVEKFEDLFGFPPEDVWWSSGSMKANAKVRSDEFTSSLSEATILGKKVVEVEFRLEESSDTELIDIDWCFAYPREGWYRWKKRIRKYLAFVEILTE